MSRYMEIEIRLKAIYGTGGMKAAFPGIARFLESYRYHRVLDEEPSLYYLVDVLTRLKNDPGVPEHAKRPIARMEPAIMSLRNEAREALLSRRLNDLDKLLYRLEDLFEDLDRELG
ncbi:MAG: hypothetical protein ABFD98_13320 [Syntrophobacteraceae bacterium]|nr:hypothetical protein [Desulfobacteraceae bacterium]